MVLSVYRWPRKVIYAQKRGWAESHLKFSLFIMYILRVLIRKTNIEHSNERTRVNGVSVQIIIFSKVE